MLCILFLALINSKMVVLWGVPEDEPLGRVYAYLKHWGKPVLFVNQRHLLDYQLRTVGGKVCLWHQQQQFSTDGVGGVYLRTNNFRELDEMKPHEAEWPTAEALENQLWDWVEDTQTARVLNKAAAMASNASKPYQAEIIKRAGFCTPRTLLTTSPQAVLAFREHHQAIIYKSISGERSIVSKLSDEHLKRLDFVKNCPTQFQEFVPGTDYRVHILADKVFACRIDSTQDDYRYDGTARLTDVRLPTHVAERCVALSQQLGLLFSGIDLRLTPDGHWYCFEVNPSPGYTYFERASGQRIAFEVACYLSHVA